MTAARSRVTVLRPIFVDLLPDCGEIREGELWISPKHRTMNLRCPCGCGELTVLSLHPSRWHIYFDGKTVSLQGSTGGSVWASSGCGSHYFIRQNTVRWAEPINPDLRPAYESVERQRLIASQSNQPARSRFKRIFRFSRLWKGRSATARKGATPDEQH